MFLTRNHLPIIQAPNLLEESWMVHGFGLKDIPIEEYLAVFSADSVQVPETKQVHGNKVHLLSKKTAGLLEADAFVTDTPGIVCHIRTADCVPILIADCKSRVVAAIHAGWRGTAAKIAAATLQAMREKWGTRGEDCKAAIGPAIGGCCYTVGPEVLRELETAGLCPDPWVHEGPRGKWHLDLAYANQHCLEKWGVPHEQIYLSLACTACDLDKFHSYRKETGAKGRQISFIFQNQTE